MIVETRLPLVDAGTVATRQEAAGYAGTFTRETNGDPFLPLVRAAASTRHIELGTAVAIAFARSPMTLAYTAHQLQEMTGGRFVLGLGTQVRPHIQRRFSMPWDAPVERMRDFLAALRAIWRSWRTGERLRYAGEFYTHTLMTPGFRPPPHDFGDPPVLLAAVGPAMTELACASSDGLLTHPIVSANYLRERTFPMVSDALRRHGRDAGRFRIAGTALVATGRDEREWAAVGALRARIAFYASTPAYRPVFAWHGWGGLADRLHTLSRSTDRQRWAEMTALVPDEVLYTIGVVAEPELLPSELARRYRGAIDRLCLSNPVLDGTTLLDDTAVSLARLSRENGPPPE